MKGSLMNNEEKITDRLGGAMEEAARTIQNFG
jgi:hypothetical protein